MARTLFRLIRPMDQWMGRNMEHKSSFMWNVIMAGQLLTAECVSFSSAYKLILNKSRNEIINSGQYVPMSLCGGGSDPIWRLMSTQCYELYIIHSG